MTDTTPRSILLPLATACMLMAIAASSYAQAQRTSHVTDDAQATSPRTAPAPSSPQPFEDLDTNGDGAISKDEAAVDPPLAQAFGTLDTDADGRLTPEEYAVYAQGQS